MPQDLQMETYICVSAVLAVWALLTLGIQVDAFVDALHGALAPLRHRVSPYIPQNYFYLRKSDDTRNYAGYNYGRGQWVPIGDVRPASGPQNGGSHHPPWPRTRCVSIQVNRAPFKHAAERVFPTSEHHLLARRRRDGEMTERRADAR